MQFRNGNQVQHKLVRFSLKKWEMAHVLKFLASGINRAIFNPHLNNKDYNIELVLKYTQPRARLAVNPGS